MSKAIIQKLSDLLETERTALLSGDLNRVSDLLAEKEDLALQLDESDAEALAPLSIALARNGALLAAARDGVGDVVATLRKQHAARTTLHTYDPTGRPSKIRNAASTTQKRF